MVIYPNDGNNYQFDYFVSSNGADDGKRPILRLDFDPTLVLKMPFEAYNWNVGTEIGGLGCAILHTGHTGNYYFAIDFEESQDLQKLIELEGYNAMLVEVDVFAPSVTFLSYISETRTKIGTNVKLIGINTSDFMVSPVSALFYIAHGMDAVVRIPNIETLVSMGLANPDLFTKEKGTHWMVPNEMLKRKLREMYINEIINTLDNFYGNIPIINTKN